MMALGVTGGAERLLRILALPEKGSDLAGTDGTEAYVLCRWRVLFAEFRLEDSFNAFGHCGRFAFSVHFNDLGTWEVNF
jgi:hypothetical protein